MNESRIWGFLIGKIGNPFGAAGMMGNLYAESGLNPINLQNTFERKLGYTDKTYTAAVDNGSYGGFVFDGAENCGHLIINVYHTILYCVIQ